jgi:hypothetical protein
VSWLAAGQAGATAQETVAHPALHGATLATSHRKVERKGFARRFQEARPSQRPTEPGFGYQRPWHSSSTQPHGVPNEPPKAQPLASM